MYSHILITTDGSELAQRGVDHGLSLAKNLASKVTVLTVTEPYPLQSAATVESWTNAQKEHAAAALAKAGSAASNMGLNAELLQTTNSSPAEAIVETAKQLGCSLIVMASHGRRGVSRLLLGSQTAEVVHYSAIPVLVVR
ncbi:universal stress protein [Pseudaminobacter sp. 19-2017]|uniref:Universal stress protein n=1 Tax=Pseudaminobacter soli (ex Zhang et al. 2022) TaxID=2831468 RepID=A0A942EC35_9HYPH|nr:universal stress protein [Pseudaminobacter soli]MBS3652422.1 universal stress protein [Pseudaminobacter soli]